VIGAGSSKEFLVVDPLMDVERFLEETAAAKGKVVGAIDTHVHADHLSGSREIRRLTGCPIFMYHSSPVHFQINPLSEGEFDLAGLRVRVIHTPGHAQEHICLLVEGRLLTGDCLLVGDVGRVDLGRGEAEQLYDSLFSKLLALDDTVEVFPGHIGSKHFVSGGTSSTIGVERGNNPALRSKSKQEFLKYMSEGWPPKPEKYKLFVKVNSGELGLAQAQQVANSSA
jgi:glyoxylase-like metal-dependent hydrolase (beta-lactamase superfamily II)